MTDKHAKLPERIYAWYTKAGYQSWNNKTSRMTPKSVDKYIRFDLFDAQTVLIRELTEMLEYWLPVDMPLKDQTDDASLFHKAKWEQAERLLPGAKSVLDDVEV